MNLARRIAQLERYVPPAVAAPVLTMEERAIRLAAFLARVGGSSLPFTDPRVVRLAELLGQHVEEAR